MSVEHVVSVCLSEYYWLSPYLCPHITCCIEMSVRLLQVVSVFLSAYYTLYRYVCPNITGCVRIPSRILKVVSVFLSAFTRCIRMSVRILQVVSVRMSAYYRWYPYFCTHITGCVPYFFPHLHAVYVCLAEYYKLYLYACLSAYYRLFPYFCLHLHVASVCVCQNFTGFICTYVCPHITGSMRISVCYWQSPFCMHKTVSICMPV
jgi:hypothetical protein